jgi:hypothetical protein
MHSAVRKDMTCLNCRHVVQYRFCSHCGQENTETRKTFHHLFLHFFEDLTHYENAFWKTIGNLVFRPGSLTKAYISGRRVSYLAPVRLYIFISFVTFLVISALPEHDSGKQAADISFRDRKMVIKESDSQKLRDSLKAVRGNHVKFGDYSSVRVLDSIQRHGKPDEKLGKAGYWITRRMVAVTEHYTSDELWEKFKEAFWHNFPKVLFVYMPIFAFVLWLFHSKKRWYYFEHGIFTLHYFSFLLLAWLVLAIFGWAMDFTPDLALFSILDFLVYLAAIGYIFYYFFPAHHRFYGGSRRRTIAYGLVMFSINSMLAGLVMIAFILYTFINIH